MSRSYKKNPITSWTAAETERFDKQKWHRAFRKNQKNKLNSIDPDSLNDMVFPIEEEVSDEWSFNKDGKHYCTDEDVAKWPQIIRK